MVFVSQVKKSVCLTEVNDREFFFFSDMRQTDNVGQKVKDFLLMQNSMEQ